MPQDVFEEYAQDYDRWFDEHRDEYLAELSRIRKVFPPPDPRSIDVGVGSGRFAAPLGIKIGVEPSRSLARMAQALGMEVIRGKAEALPIRTESCSSVLFVTVICFLDDPVPVFRELHRVLCIRGSLIVAFIEREGEIHRKYRREPGKGRFLSRARFYSQGEVRTFLEGSGFRVRKVDARSGFCVIAAQRDENALVQSGTA